MPQLINNYPFFPSPPTLSFSCYCGNGFSCKPHRKVKKDAIYLGRLKYIGLGFRKRNHNRIQYKYDEFKYYAFE